MNLNQKFTIRQFLYAELIRFSGIIVLFAGYLILKLLEIASTPISFVAGILLSGLYYYFIGIPWMKKIKK